MAVAGRTYPPGAIFVPAGAETLAKMKMAAESLGLSVAGVEAIPGGEALRLRPVRIGLWDQYGGSMASGWARWLLEQYEFPFEVVFPPRLDAGNLRADYDVLVFVGGAVSLSDRQPKDEFRAFAPPSPEEVPAGDR